MLRAYFYINLVGTLIGGLVILALVGMSKGS